MVTQSVLDQHFRPVINFRDLGGYPTKDARRIKEGIFFRSGGLCYMNEAELSFFKTLGIRYCMDLRTKTETSLCPDPVIDGICYLQHSGLEFANGKEIDFSPLGMSQIGSAGKEQLEKLRRYYNMIPFGNEAFRILFDEITAHHVPLVFHCATGKDRTGVFAMLLLLALGATRETALEDYLLSRSYFRETLQQELEEKADELRLHPELEELITMRLSVSETIGRGILDTLFARYPVIEDYFLAEYDLSGDDLQELRDTYCV